MRRKSNFDNLPQRQGNRRPGSVSEEESRVRFSREVGDDPKLLVSYFLIKLTNYLYIQLCTVHHMVVALFDENELQV